MCVCCVEKLTKNLIGSSQLSVSRSASTADLSFTIEHYAGRVEYSAQGFLDKNQDRLAVDIINLLSASKSDLVRQLFDSHTFTPVGTSFPPVDTSALCCYHFTHIILCYLFLIIYLFCLWS